MHTWWKSIDNQAQDSLIILPWRAHLIPPSQAPTLWLMTHRSRETLEITENNYRAEDGSKQQRNYLYSFCWRRRRWEGNSRLCDVNYPRVHLGQHGFPWLEGRTGKLHGEGDACRLCLMGCSLGRKVPRVFKAGCGGVLTHLASIQATPRHAEYNK